MIYLLGASRTFKNFPLRGKTPKWSLPTTSIPAKAKDFAESPSVKIIVHYSACLVPAKFASSSLGTPRSFAFFFPGPRVLANFASSLALATVTMLSITPDPITSFKNLSLRVQVEPKLEGFVVRVSLV
jgi:hypothetical protein